MPRGDDEKQDPSERDGERERHDDGGPLPREEEPGEIDVVIAAPPAHPLGVPLTLDGSSSSQSEGRLLTYAWSVKAPEGQGCAPSLSDTSLPTLTFTPLCEGPHDATLEASMVDGESQKQTVRVDVLSVSVAFDEIVAAPRGRSSEVFVVVEQDAIPSGVITLVLEATPRAPFTEEPEVSGDGNPFLVPMLDPLVTYDLVARAMVDDVVVSEADATATVTALNSAPVVSNLRLEPGLLAFGGSVTLLADVSDPEGDDVSCEASVSAGDATGFGITPPSTTPSGGVCSFTLTAPQRLEQWTITVTASDGNATSLPATLVVQPENAPPSLSVSIEGASSRGYGCTGPGTCASEPFTLVLDMDDDIDDVEDLVVAVESDEAALPAGVLLTVEPHPTDAAKRLVRFERDSHGPMKGVWPVTVTVTEATALDDLVASTSQTVELEVTNLAPTASPLPGANTHHTYTAAAGYTGTLRFEANVSDPEANALALVPTLVSCPTAAAGASACGGAGLQLDLVEATVDGAGRARVLYDVSASSLEALVGTYTLALSVTDADGASVTVPGLTSAIQNRTPTRVATRSAHHSYSGGQYRASFSAMYADPDGDPLTLNLQVRCPNGHTVSLGQGCNGSTPIVSANDGTITITSAGGSTSGFIGTYQIQGTISDRVSTIGSAGATLMTLTVQNRPPANPALVSSSSRRACNHRTIGGTVVRNDSGCDFVIVASGSDPDGDPIRLRLRTDGPYDFRNPSDTPLTTASPRTRSFGLESTFAVYKANQKTTILAYHEDGFGARSAEVPIQVELLNRLPVWGNDSTLTPRNLSGTYGLLETEVITGGGIGVPLRFRYEPFDAITSSGASGVAYGPKACSAVGGGCSNTMSFSIRLDVSDPDGDPLEVRPYVECTYPVTMRVNGVNMGPYVPHRPNLSAQMVFPNASCGSDHVQTPVTLIATGTMGFRCTLTDTTTAASDGIGQAVLLPVSKYRNWRVPASATTDQCK